MKKSFSSKKNNKRNECYTRFKSDLPKRTLTSTWNIRNDSTNISSILQPENYLQSPKQSSDRGVYKKCLLSDNTCYCVDKKIRPKLMPRPRTCLSLDNFKNEFIRSDLMRRPSKQNYVLQECHCRDVAGNSTSSTGSALLKRYRDELESKCDCLEYTDARKDYNQFREEQVEEDLRELENYEESVDAAREVEEEKEIEEEEEDYSVSTIMGTRHETTKTTLSSDFGDQDEATTSIEDLNVFRNEHYFETHSIENLGKDVSRHTCIHQFRLDDRLLPEPLNVDPYGRSRCSICSKPMEGDTMQLSKSYFSDKPSSVTLRNLAKCSELGLVPRSVSIGGDRSKIELRVDPSERSKLGMLVGKIRKPQYFNTFALRQQRMSY